MKLSVFIPLPPAATGIADYGATLLAELAKRANGWDIVAISPDEGEGVEVPVQRPDELGAEETPGIGLYHVGNSRYHDFVYPFVSRRPGILVLHDLVLHHSRLASYLSSPEVRAYREDMGSRDKRARAFARLEEYRKEVLEAYPDQGELIAEIALRIGGGRLLYDFPLYEHLVRRSLRTIVHSTTALEAIRERCPEADVRRVRMGVSLPPLVPREEARHRLGLPPGVMLASFGLVTPEKRISLVLRALARLRARGVEATYVLVGASVPHYDPRIEARELGVDEALHLVGRVPEEELSLYAFASDICLNLRYPSAGETSAMLLRLLACGRPVVVTDQMGVEDFPDPVVFRSPLEGSEDGLYCDLMDLIANERLCHELGERARSFAAREHSVEQMGTDYTDALEDAL